MTKILVTQSNKGWAVLHLQCMKHDLNCLRAIFHKLYNKRNKLLIFGILGEIGIFSVFEKKLSEKKKKAIFIVSRTTLCTQKIKFYKRLFAYKIRFAVEKKSKKCLGQVFKITTENFLCRIWKLYGKHFFQKPKLKSVFCHHCSHHCSTVHKKPQNWLKFFLLFFENV